MSKDKWIIAGVITACVIAGIFMLTNSMSEAEPDIKPFASETFNGLIIDAYDVEFTKNTDTGKYIMTTSVRLENTNDTSFRLESPFLSGYNLDEIPDKLTGGEVIYGTISRQTKAKAPSTIENRTTTLMASDMSNEDWNYIDLVVPDEYFKVEE